jgi:hypothetical protein
MCSLVLEAKTVNDCCPTGPEPSVMQVYARISKPKGAGRGNTVHKNKYFIDSFTI